MVPQQSVLGNCWGVMLSTGRLFPVAVFLRDSCCDETQQGTRGQRPPLLSNCFFGTVIVVGLWEPSWQDLAHRYDAIPNLFVSKRPCAGSDHDLTQTAQSVILTSTLLY